MSCWSSKAWKITFGSLLSNCGASPVRNVASAEAGPDVGIYPIEVVSGGWNAVGRLKTFTNETVYEKIDGQEVQYNSFGLQFMHFLAIANGDVEMNIELYDMGEFQNALGIYAEQRSEGSSIQKVGTSGFATLTEVGALATVNQFYIKFSANQPDPSIEPHVLKVVEAFSKEQGDSGDAPPAFGILNDGLGIDFLQIGYKKSDVFQYDFAKDFWFGAEGGDSKLQYFVHQDASSDGANELFGLIMEEHEFEYEVLNQADSDVMMRHEFLKTFNTMNKSGAYVFGVEGAATQDEAQAAINKLKSLIEAEQLQ